jgi:hypothetical protein
LPASRALIDPTALSGAFLEPDPTAPRAPIGPSGARPTRYSERASRSLTIERLLGETALGERRVRSPQKRTHPSVPSRPCTMSVGAGTTRGQGRRSPPRNAFDRTRAAVSTGGVVVLTMDARRRAVARPIGQSRITRARVGSRESVAAGPGARLSVESRCRSSSLRSVTIRDIASGFGIGSPIRFSMLRST